MIQGNDLQSKSFDFQYYDKFIDDLKINLKQEKYFKILHTIESKECSIAKIRSLIRTNLIEIVLKSPNLLEIQHLLGDRKIKRKKKDKNSPNSFSITSTLERIFVHIPNTLFTSGAFKDIHLALSLPSKDIIVRARLSKKVKLSKFNTGAVVFERCGTSPYIVQTFAINSETAETFMKYYPRGSLLSLLEKENSIPNLKKMLLSCARAILALHEKRITHNDIKPENFLLNDDDEIPVVICDFDLIDDWDAFDKKIVEEKTTYLELSSAKGSPLYMPPEKLLFRPTIYKYKDEAKLNREKKGDIYSLGIVFYLLVNNKTILPWLKGVEITLQLRTIANALLNYSLFDEVFPEPKTSDTIMHLIWEMLQPINENRPAIESVIERLEKIP